MPFQHGTNTVQLPYLLPRGQLKFHCLKACLRCHRSRKSDPGLLIDNKSVTDLWADGALAVVFGT